MNLLSCSENKEIISSVNYKDISISSLEYNFNSEILNDYSNAIKQIAMIVYEYYNIFKKDYVICLFGDIYLPLKIYFQDYIQLIFLNNNLSNNIINNIGKRLNRLYYLYNIIINRKY